ncbi:MAG: hypothetical protein JJU05_07370 [Verrucomicrobia bacterium]|nr:hypothetical protein [Verrucomicrobiota bacterium]MCH8526117.1 hypothetical protein [Kiritimatiellia bacterium]
MSPDESLYRIWAPAASVWSAWAKPIAFIGASRMTSRDMVGPLDQPSILPEFPGRDTAVVIDLPGAESVQTGLMYSEQGCRPVPLFNARAVSPAPVDMSSVRYALKLGAPRLQSLSLPDDAPPVFLLDARRKGKGAPLPGEYDNRSVHIPQDFPSAARLRSAGIRRVIVRQRANTYAPDLSHVLYAWQKGGLDILHESPDTRLGPVMQNPVRPPFFNSLFQDALVRIGLRRSSAGGFGGLIPLPSESSGYSGTGFGYSGSRMG